MTGRDYDKIFRSRKLGQKLEPPRYELLTEEEINELNVEVELKARQKLQMPPLLQDREPINNILSVNPEIQGFDTSKYVFTDITFGLPNRVSYHNQHHMVIHAYMNKGLIYFRNAKLLSETLREYLRKLHGKKSKGCVRSISQFLAEN